MRTFADGEGGIVTNRLPAEELMTVIRIDREEERARADMRRLVDALPSTTNRRSRPLAPASPHPAPKSAGTWSAAAR
jgi:hypothetical protein